MKNYLLQCDVTARHYNVLNTTYSSKRYLLLNRTLWELKLLSINKNPRQRVIF